MFLPGVKWWEWWASCRGNQTFVNWLQMSDTWCCFLVTVDYEYVRVLVTTYQSKWIWLKCSKWWSWSDADMMLIRLERYIKMCLKTSVSHNFEKKIIAIASAKKFDHCSSLMLMQWGHTWVEEAMVSNRYLWSSWNGCHCDYYDRVIEAFSLKV